MKNKKNQKLIINNLIENKNNKITKKNKSPLKIKINPQNQVKK